MNRYDWKITCPQGKGEAKLTMNIRGFRRTRPAIAYAPVSEVAACDLLPEGTACDRPCGALVQAGTGYGKPNYRTNRVPRR